MRVLVFANTPAHVHTYRHAVTRLIERGHDVHILARDYACTLALLEFFDLPYTCYGSHGTDAYSRAAFASELGGQLATITQSVFGGRPDLVFGRGPYGAFAGTLARAPVVLVLDDEPGHFNYTVSKPFATCILSPEATRRNFGPKHYTFDGFKECAYLHPDVFTPRGDVREYLGVDPDEPYALLRFNALDALHDMGRTGFTPSQRQTLIEAAAKEATVFVSDESGSMDLTGLPARPYQLHPALIHDAIAEANLLVADTGTMVTEAGLLGTPALRYTAADDHSFGEFKALERAGLAEQFASFESLTPRALEILSTESVGRDWMDRRSAFVGDLTDLTTLLVDVAEAKGTMSRLENARSRVRPRSLSPIS